MTSNKKQISITALIAVITIAMTASPSGFNLDNLAFAGGAKDDGDDGGNSASQIIAQV